MGIGDGDESPGVVIRVGDRLRLLIHVRSERPRRVVSPAFGRAVGVGRAGLLVSHGVRERVRVPCAVGRGGEQSLLPGGVIGVCEDVAVRFRACQQPAVDVVGQRGHVAVRVGDRQR